MLTPADKAGGSVAGAREDPGALIGPGSLSPDGWIYGGLGATLAGASPQPGEPHWRGGGFHHAADRDAICLHVVIVIIPFAGWAGSRRAFESAPHSSPIRCTGVAAGGNAVPSGTRFTMIVTTPSAACIC